MCIRDRAFAAHALVAGCIREKGCPWPQVRRGLVHALSHAGLHARADASARARTRTAHLSERARERT
eukprot:15389822-Alexandrium_andersonii.AAC.1